MQAASVRAARLYSFLLSGRPATLGVQCMETVAFSFKLLPFCWASSHIRVRWI